MKRFLKATLILSFTGLAAPAAQATIIGVSGPDSTAGIALEIISAPSDLLDDAIAVDGMKGFDEAQGVVTAADYQMDFGVTLETGARVDSHMIFLNSVGPTAVMQYQALWTFDGLILGVMSDRFGLLEFNSTPELGAPGTNYSMSFPGSGPAAPFEYRGLERNLGGNGQGDGYSVNGNQILVDMFVTEPGDWIRVVTASPEVTTTNAVPAPPMGALLSLGILALGYVRRRRN